MHRQTLAFFEGLQRAKLFSQVGAIDTPAAIVLASWEQAIACCSSLEWENFCLDMANEYRGQLRKRSVERFNNWNDIVDSMKKTLIPFLRSKIEPVAREHGLPKVFEATVQWDILHACMETDLAGEGACPVSFEIPRLESAADALTTLSRIAEAVGAGTLAPDEADELSKPINRWIDALKAVDFEARLKKLEEERDRPKEDHRIRFEFDPPLEPNPAPAA